jgi:spore coat protein H
MNTDGKRETAGLRFLLETHDLLKLVGTGLGWFVALKPVFIRTIIHKLRSTCLSQRKNTAGVVTVAKPLLPRVLILPANLLCVVWLCCVPSVFCASSSGHANEHKTAPPDDIFAGTNVLHIKIQVSQAGMNELRHTGWGNNRDRPVVQATIKEGGVIYTNVSLHLKGSAGSFRQVDDNPCFTLNFDKAAPGQSFHGLHKLSLNNSVQDHSFLTEKICRELFDAAGVPVPRAGHAVVELNGRNLGLHVLTEGFGKHFLKRYFKNTKGNLYDGGFVQDVTSPLAVNSGDNPNDNSGLRALASAAREPDPTTKMARLEQTLDMDRFLSFVAMDIIQCDWDGYAMNHNNWRIFHDLDSNKMVFMPHGLDQMFGVERATPDCPILPSRLQGLVARAVLGTAEGRRRYLERVAQLYTNVFHADALVKRVDELAAVINPAIAEYSPNAARRHEAAVENLKRRILMRDESLSRQLSSTSTEPTFASDGTLKLNGWRRSIRSGQPEFRQEKSGDGRAGPLLYISARNGTVSASWRTRVLLDEGTYRFEGKIRTSEVKSESGEGARIRISRGTGPRGLSGTADWQEVSYSFEVPDSGAEVEFVCELRASQGEACFDGSSLRLVHVNE